MRETPIAALVAATLLTSSLHAQVLAREFEQDYSVLDLGQVPGVPFPYGGLRFKLNDANTLLIGGDANTTDAKIFAVSVVRDANGHVSGFGCGVAVEFAEAYGTTDGIDGGLDYAPNGVILYTTWDRNKLGQIRPGETAPAKILDLETAGIAISSGTIRIVPPGFPGAGRAKVTSYTESRWYDRILVADGSGTYNLLGVSGGIQLDGGPEGIIYVAAGNPGFNSTNVLVTRFNSADVVAYEVNDNGDPQPATLRPFLTAVPATEGAAVDPLTGDFLFSTFEKKSRVIAVQGFTQTLGCRSDLTGDKAVDAADLAIILGEWGQTGGGLGDILADCVIDGSDLSVLLGDWGSCGG